MIKAASFPDGTDIGVWIRFVKGSEDGPTLSLLGAQHGEEYNGIEIINRIVYKLDPK